MEKDDTSIDRFIDTPTTEDILGFQHLAEVIANAVTAQPNNTSLTLGLDGPWGSGKSTILLSLQKAISKQTQDRSSGSIGLIVIPYSPWLITNRTALVGSFFGQLGNAIEQAAKRASDNTYLKRRALHKTFKSLQKKIHDFSILASIAATVTSSFDPTLVSAVTGGSADALSKLTKNGENTLEERKSELERTLRNIAKGDPSFRILVLIDDLDRLDPDDALEVVRLVKTVGDLPAITYLLAYDRDALVNAITKSLQIDNGNSYLEKIIQFSFKVPPLEPFKLRNWLRTELDDLFPGDIDFGSERARTVLDIWTSRLLHTPRDVKRLLFAVRAIWPTIRNRADLLDLIWLQMVKEKASQDNNNLYGWVSGYLQAMEAAAIGGQVTGQKEDCRKLVGILSSMGWRSYDNKEEWPSFDFHNLDTLLAGVKQSYLDDSIDQDANKIWTHQADTDELQRYREERRLSSPWHWRLYFAFDTPSHAVTDEEWDALAIAAGRSLDSLIVGISDLLTIRGDDRKDVADQLLDRAIHEQQNGKLTNPGHWLIAFVKQNDTLRATSKDHWFGFQRISDLSIEKFSRAVFKTLAGNDRTSALQAVFEDPSNLCIAAKLLRDELRSHENNEEYYLTDEELEFVVKAQVSQYEQLTPEDLRSLSLPYAVLYAWRDATDGSKTGPAALLETAMQDNEGIVTTLKSLKTINSSDQGNIPRVVEDYLKHFVDVKALKYKVQRMATSKDKHTEAARDLLKVWWSSDD